MNKDTVSKLNEILDLELAEDEERISAAQLLQFEITHGVKVPEVYKDYLKNYGTCYIKDDYYFPMKEQSPLTSDDGMEMMDFFYNQEFADTAHNFFEIWGKQILPIGSCSGGGDYICIGLEGEKRGKIYFLYHEDEQREDGLYLAADSFDEFVRSFRYIPEKSQERPHVVGRVELCEELLNQLKHMKGDEV